MSPLRLAAIELRRLSTSRIRRLALAALVIIPTLYGGLYLYANRDPYGNLSNVPAALVVEDAGASTRDGNRLNAGRDLAEDLVSSGSFAWRQVDAQEAATGVGEGRYDFAVTVPRDFSAALVSTQRFDPRQARITMTTNDANSYLSVTIADNVADQIRDSLARRVSTQAATDFLLGITQTKAALVRAADGADRLERGIDSAGGGARRLAGGAQQLSEGASQLATGTDQLSSGLSELTRRTEGLPAQVERLASGARQVANGDARFARTGREVAAAATALRQRYREGRQTLAVDLAERGYTEQQRREVLALYDRLEGPLAAAVTQVQGTSADLDRLAAGAGQVAQGATRLAAGTDELATGIRSARDGAARLDAGAGEVSGGADQLAAGGARLAAGTDELAAGADRLREGLRRGSAQLPQVDAEARTRLASTISDPVAIQSTSHGARTYGAGLAPFFLPLAMWIGGYVLFLLARPLSNRALAGNQASWRVAVGGWLFPVLVGMAQVAVLFTLVVLGLGIEPAQPAATVGFMLLTSATFMAMVHSLNAWLGPVGQFLGLVLMILQLVSAGGTFPWQTLPEPLRYLHDVLPMSYAVDGLRQLMYGGLSSLVARDVAVLAAYLLASVALTTLAARRGRTWSVARIKPELVL